MQWLLHLHAPMARWTPFAAAGCFAASSFTNLLALRWLLEAVAAVLLILIAADLARALMERQPAISVGGNPVPPGNVPVDAFQILLTGVAAAVYTALIFIGLVNINPVATLLLLPVIYVLACLAAWRNVRLWYQQGAEYEDELREVRNEQAEKERLKEMRLPRSQWDRRPPFS